MGKTKDHVNSNNAKIDEIQIKANKLPTLVPYDGENPYVPQADDKVLPAGTWLKNGLTIKGVEDVTDEVAAQTPLVDELLESLVGKASGADAKPEDLSLGKKAYVGQKLIVGTRENPVAGMHVMAENAEGYPIDVVMNYPNGIPDRLFYMTTVDMSLYQHKYCENITIDTPTVGIMAFNEFLAGFNGKLKLKNVTELDIACFCDIGVRDSSITDKKRMIWLPKTLTNILGTNYTSSPFYKAHAGIKIYCESESKPSGWSSTWNNYKGDGSLTTEWGISEAEFDAL